jgi:hypothetical protein
LVERGELGRSRQKLLIGSVPSVKTGGTTSVSSQILSDARGRVSPENGLSKRELS